MSDERDTPDDLYPFAQMLVKQLLKQYRLRWKEHKMPAKGGPACV